MGAGLSCHTADGRPARIACAHARLARTICADTSMFTREEAHAAARAVSAAQLTLLARQARLVLSRMAEPPGTVIISGQGEFLARRLVERLRLSVEIVSLSATLGASVSEAAAAHAAAVLARRQGLG